MRRIHLLLVLLGLLACAGASYGLATFWTGPDSNATTAQPHWPTGILRLLRHESRVYSSWVNGDEHYYFKASPDQMNELIRVFSETRMRDHELRIKAGKRYVNDDKIRYNVNLHILGGSALGVSRSRERPKTYEPTLTVYVDPIAAGALLKQITLPTNIILNNKIANSPLKGTATKAKRKVWHAQVQFDDSTPATDSSGVFTKITLWEKDTKGGIKLGNVGQKSYFHAAFSDKEIADLKTDKSWLTLTVGGWATQAKRDDPKLSVEKLVLDKENIQPLKIPKPKFYYGRIISEDGSASIPVPARWHRSVLVLFSYAGAVSIDSNGYFKVYFTKEQYEKVKSEKMAAVILGIPGYTKKGRSTAHFAFPVSKLSQEKEEAGVVRLPKPGPKDDG